MDTRFKMATINNLVWLPEKGWGYYNVDANPYDQGYLENYIKLADTPIGKNLLDFRLELVKKFAPNSSLVDIGVGSGSFVRARPYTKGYDINPHAVEFLKKEGLWSDYYNKYASNISCWDSFEHIQNTTALLQHMNRFVFMSIPIFENLDHLLKSKHFKKTEHCYYFTEQGLIEYMIAHDFNCLHVCYEEVRIGREDIGTFVFERNL